MVSSRLSTAKALTWFLLIAIFAVFFVRGVVSLDPDFGWHYKMGELILTSGIPQSDPFSYTMPSFAFIDHEWLTNVLIYLGQVYVSYPVLAALFALIATLALFLPLARHRSSESWLVLVLASGSLIGYVGVRPQLLSWLLLALVTLILSSTKLHKFQFLLPLIAFVWVNLHGSFPVALVVYAIWVVTRWLHQRQIDRVQFLTLFLALLASFVNPYGPRIWDEVFRQFTDTSLRWSIAEWVPTLFVTNFPLSFYAVLSVYFVGKYRSRFDPAILAVYAVLLLQGLSAFRHAPLWVIFSLPITVQALTHFRVSLPKVAESRYAQVFQFAFALAGTMFAVNAWLGISTGLRLSKQNFYPVAAVNYLDTHPFEGELFSDYGWGGYLIWQLPYKKVFIDGRMPSWRWPGAPQTESPGAFDDYQAVLTGDMPFTQVAAKYDITRVLWPKRVQSSLLSRFSEKISNLFNRKRNSFHLDTALEQEGWRVVYEDGVAVVYSAN